MSVPRQNSPGAWPAERSRHPGWRALVPALDTAGLSQEVDAPLAWAVREGTTNVVRHSRATRVDISLCAGPAVAEITDNGPPAPDDVGPLTRLPADSVPARNGAAHNGAALVTRPRPAARG